MPSQNQLEYKKQDTVSLLTLIYDIFCKVLFFVILALSAKTEG